MKICISFLFALQIGSAIYAQSVSTLTPEFNGSGGLSLDGEGNLIIADFGDFLSAGDGDGIPNKIMVLDTDLTLSEYSTGFIGASGNTFDSNGILYQSDIGASAIYKIIDGVRTFVTSTGISGPVGITFDSQDNFYVCNCSNSTIRKVTPDGTSTLFASGAIFACPNGITADEDDNLYVSCFSNGNIIKITPDGDSNVLVATLGGSTSPPSNGHLDYHQPTRTLYIASHANNQIFSLDIDDPTELAHIAGSGVRGNSDGDAETATFSRPNGVAITQTGDSIYINSAIPLTNSPNNPLNPQVVRLITGVQSTVSVETLGVIASDIRTYPNPVNDILILEINLVQEFKRMSLIVTDAHGRVVTELADVYSNDKQIRLQISTRSLASGMYTYSLLNDRNVLLSGKFSKE